MCILQTGKWTNWPFSGLKQWSEMGIYEYEVENYSKSCDLLIETISKYFQPLLSQEMCILQTGICSLFDLL